MTQSAYHRLRHRGQQSHRAPRRSLTPLSSDNFYPAIHDENDDMALFNFYNNQPQDIQERYLNQAISLLEQVAQSAQSTAHTALTQLGQALRAAKPRLEIKDYAIVTEFADRARLSVTNSLHEGNSRRFLVVTQAVEKKKTADNLYKKLAVLAFTLLALSAIIGLCASPAAGLVLLAVAGVLWAGVRASYARAFYEEKHRDQSIVPNSLNSNRVLFRHVNEQRNAAHTAALNNLREPLPETIPTASVATATR